MTDSDASIKSDGSTEEEWAAAMEEQKAASRDGNDKTAGAGATAAPMPELSASAGEANPDGNLELILDVPVTLAMEIGRVRVPIRNLLQLTQGSVVELDRLAGEPLDVTVNGTLIAHGEVVVVNERYGIRFTDVVSAAERVQKLK